LKKRQWLFWLLIIIFIWVVASRHTEIQHFTDTLTQGQWEWVLAAIGVTVFGYVFRTLLYQSAFYTVGVTSHLRGLLPVLFASIFVNVTVPTGGASGAALFVDDAARRGQSPVRTMAGMFLYLAADFVSFTFILIAGIVYLYFLHDLFLYEIIAALILVIMILGLIGVLMLGYQQPARLRQLLTWLQMTVNRLALKLKRPALLDGRWVDATANEFTEAAAAITLHPKRLARTIGVAVAVQLFNVAILYFLFLAFHQSIGFGTLVAGYAMGMLFWIVSITPQGIGVVEGVLTLVFTSLSIPAEKAAVVALSYRGLTFWLPFGIGFLLLRRVKSFKSEGQEATGSLNARAMAAIASILGIAYIYSTNLYLLADRIDRAIQTAIENLRYGPNFTAALAGCMLLLYVGNLWRRK
jgi:uncharacterized protein (TIRG00374 family)